MEILTFDAVVIGSGAAAYNAACRIAQGGRKSVCIVTEGVKTGTSRNTGSDKQTYYKLNLGASPEDSVQKMAEDLFACGCVDGDTAFCEAALSARCFLRLVELGVPFPCGPYGEYVGYKTDHDPYARASSAGPLTSKFMTEALEREAARLDVPVYDQMYVTEILTDGNGVCGVAAVRTDTGAFCALRCRYAVLATGGPAGIYADSVYPACHTGSTSLALNAGAALQNMTEWQYGLASIAPRWNVSGTYMQALPRLVSVDGTGAEREFLTDYLPSVADALNAVFLKGYQWPFDSAKAAEGSSRVDLAVYTETVIKKRTVYLDYTKNPFGLEALDASLLSDEARDYLAAAGALSGRPIDRLRHMNEPAYELFWHKGVDLTKEPLRIALCAQHCNGGISVDADWQTTVPGLYAAGECAGTHGITRPGGSALNAGQAGSLRAAEAINRDDRSLCSDAAFAFLAETARQKHDGFIGALLSRDSNVADLTHQARERFSAACAAVRIIPAFNGLTERTEELLDGFAQTVQIAGEHEAADAYRLRDALTVQRAMLAALQSYWMRYGVSRGSAAYLSEPPAGDIALTFAACGKDEVQEVRLADGIPAVTYRPVRPLPAVDTCFENVWREFRLHNKES